ncbi:MAG: OmpA/MotB family protein [Phycisphaerae bacterium]
MNASSRNRLPKTILAMIGCFIVAGCASPSPEEQIAMLEDENQTLARNLDGVRQQNAGLRDELARFQSAQDAWDAALLAARNEADDLRRELANQPEPAPRELAAPGWTTVPGGAMISVPGNVLFAPGRVEIRNEARRSLESIISAVNGQYSDKQILVFGHTDNTPIKRSGWKDNWELSSERALSVVRYLTKKGVGASRLAACGCGEFRPVAGNSANNERARNRRVEIYAIEPQS